MAKRGTVSKDINSIEHLLYPVEMVPSKTLFPKGFKFSKQQEFTIVVDIPEGRKIVNSCSKGYHLVPNKQILDGIVPALEGKDISFTGSAKEDCRFEINIIMNDNTLKLDKGGKDALHPKLKIANSYDGRVKYSFAMGFFRLICSNGMVVAEKGTEDVNKYLKKRHTPGLADDVDTEEIYNLITEFQEAAPLLIKPYQELQKKIVTDLEDRVNEVIEETKFSSRRTEDVLYRIEEEMKILSAPKPTDWLIYSGLNYQLNHSPDIKMDAHKKEKVDQQVLNWLIEN